MSSDRVVRPSGPAQAIGPSAAPASPVSPTVEPTGLVDTAPLALSEVDGDCEVDETDGDTLADGEGEDDPVGAGLAECVDDGRGVDEERVFVGRLVAFCVPVAEGLPEVPVAPG